MRNWSFPHCTRAVSSWASSRGNGAFTLSGVSVRTKWTHFLSDFPGRLANSSAKMLFQGFRLLFTFSVGRCGPKAIQLPEWGQGSGSEHRGPQREAAWARASAAPPWLCQPAVFRSGCARASWPSTFTSVTPILIDEVSLAFPFILWKHKIWFHLYEILGKAKLI